MGAKTDLFFVLWIALGLSAAGKPPAVSKWTRSAPGPIPSKWSFGAGSCDLRSLDLSGADLSDRRLKNCDFDTDTVWPEWERMPENFNPRAILERALDPGLGVRALHKKGITGKGVAIAVIDQPPDLAHAEYAGRLAVYEDMHALPAPQAEMHGPAVAGLAAGKRGGVAPEAVLYYFTAYAFDAGKDDRRKDMRFYARALRRVLEINESLPSGGKIRAVTMQIGWDAADPGGAELDAVVSRAKAEGIFVISSNLEKTYGFRYGGLGRDPSADPDDHSSYGPGRFWAAGISSRMVADALMFPMDSRGAAGFTGQDSLVFYRNGGSSWVTPYIAGLYALAAQVDPWIEPDKFWRLAARTARKRRVFRAGWFYTLNIADPPALIAALAGVGERGSLDSRPGRAGSER
jgi:hypothetical protein